MIKKNSCRRCRRRPIFESEGSTPSRQYQTGSHDTRGDQNAEPSPDVVIHQNLQVGSRACDCDTAGESVGQPAPNCNPLIDLANWRHFRVRGQVWSTSAPVQMCNRGDAKSSGGLMQRCFQLPFGAFCTLNGQTSLKIQLITGQDALAARCHRVAGSAYRRPGNKGSPFGQQAWRLRSSHAPDPVALPIGKNGSLVISRSRQLLIDPSSIPHFYTDVCDA
jgi:hypothetical protein